jgi:hypothetical protein
MAMISEQEYRSREFDKDRIIDELNEEVNALRADAKRYRWVRKQDPITVCRVMSVDGTLQNIDSAIDSEMKEKP